jgi:DNA polymerase-3 subunit alpha
MENIPLFARRKNSKLNIKYLLPQLEPILAPTYGIIVYQEQIMQMVRVIAGFSFAEADNFRKAISKKDMSKMESLRNDFIKGAIKNGVNKIDALKVFNLIEKFANYGFNKSHSLLYAVFATRMAYLKYHYPLEFYGAILDNISNQNDIKFSGVVNEMKKISLKIAGPDINISTLSFTYNNSSLVFPLDTIKGLHRTVAIQIIEERNNNGKYLDFFDFVTRMTPYGITASSINKLIDAGAFDSLYKLDFDIKHSLVDKVIGFELFILNFGGK